MQPTEEDNVIKRLLMTATTMLAFAATLPAASAADLPARNVYAPVTAPLPVYNWTGIYLGVNGGYGFGKQDPLSLFSGDFNSFEYSANGWLFGGTFGAQIQSGHVVIGVEGDLDWANFKGSGTGPVSKLGGGITGTATLSSKVSAISTLRTRIGYAENNWLFYATVGLAVTKATSEFTQTVGFVCGGTTVPCTSKSDLHPGVAAGAGVEYGITQNVSAKLEYLWLGAGATNTLKENMVRAGLNYRFGGI
jgi:outer membrane immunogenic protein